ncbi:hypothetical protein ACHHYP_14531 [Achlya hypogyna]|uniref:Uncharacterized protein n=1 Tax=Achlya hypogyna TaxID=1202772 RepID=A0A1V9YCZ6_ACHHY|nr:hypothetical protein ACHHYP_14531 [Achlya hypogyna]
MPASPEVPSTTTTPVPADERCKYAYKECKERRSRRKNGKLHSLCDYHRKKANSVQKSYATKRRNMQVLQNRAAAAKAAEAQSAAYAPVVIAQRPSTTYAIPPPVLGFHDYDHAMRLDEIKRRIQSAWERRHIVAPVVDSAIYYYPPQPQYLVAQTNH